MTRTRNMPSSRPAGRLDWPLLGFAYLVIAIALTGFATYGLRPELLAGSPRAARLYGPIYASIGQIQVWLLWGVLAVVLIRRAGLRWVPAFAAVYGISFLAEFLGTSYGVPFGGYTYTALLGGKWFGHVPYVIPLSWFAMAVPSFALAGAFGWARTPFRRVLVASAILLVWDLALDPAMSHLTPYWVWSDTGPYYGMPWLNLVGWYVTGLAIMIALTGLRAESWIDRMDRRWMGAYYGLNILMPVGMLIAAGMWLAVGTTVAAGAILASAARLSYRPAPRLLPATDAAA